MDQKHSGMKQILSIYWPIAISWLFMAADIPAITAFVSRMPDAENCLATFGGVSRPLSYLIEAPVIMLLSTSIALCKDRKNFLRVRKLMRLLVVMLTFVHILVCLPPVFDLVVMKIIGSPETLRQYNLNALILLIPWTGSIGYRRFYQGVLIRYRESKTVTIGTFIRMGTLIVSLAVCYWLREKIDGASAASFASGFSVFIESMYIGLRAKRTVKKYLSEDDDRIPLISKKELVDFVTPLVMTSFVNYIWMFIGGAAMNRMPQPIISLAVWPVLSGVIDILKCFGSAVNETALAVLAVPELRGTLKRFVGYVVLFSFLVFALLLIPFIGDFWFVVVSGLTGDILQMSRKAYPLLFLIPLTWSIYNYYSAVLVDGHYTKPVFESLLVYLGGMLCAIGLGIATQAVSGVFIVTAGSSMGYLLQLLWIAFRAKRRAVLEKN